MKGYKMKQLIVLGALVTLTMTIGKISLAADSHPAKHQFILFGDSQIFASHIIAQPPHNYQVLLEIKVNEDEKQSYLDTKVRNPDAKIIFVVNSIDLHDIASAKSLSGDLLVEQSDGQRKKILPTLSVAREDFKIIYTDEVVLGDHRLLETDQCGRTTCKNPWSGCE